ncbi:MAG TPA: hypothetical protein VMG99_04010 [Thermoplasmata archaeon]|jgi:5,10-methylenetetrahydrofolate reductase|nr:hypothetical protein [Thermoplasmata archaeon]
MRRALPDALRREPLFFEPAPPSARAAGPRTDQRLGEVARWLRDLPRIDAVVVPELVDENHEGRPFYRSADPRAYARAIADRSGATVVVNKVVAHLASGPELVRWAEETVAAGLVHLVLVGGASRYIPYPGPSVVEANRLCRPVVEPAGGRLGNVAIPTRGGEAHRMLAKTRAGASFFTTQLAFDAEPVAGLVREYDALCARALVPPAAVLVSFAPVADESDVEYVRWLGAEIPEAVERAILEDGESAGPSASLGRALGVWEALRAAWPLESGRVPLGVNVEQVSARHFEPARELANRFAERLGAPGP